MPKWTVRDEVITSHGALSVFHAAIDELNRRYEGSDEGHRLLAEELLPPRGVFLVARVDGHLSGGVGLRPIGEATLGIGEVKRLWVRPDQRRCGIAHSLMSRLEQHARHLNYRQLYLETGHAQPEASALYEASGWSSVEKFPEGAFSYPNALRFTKIL